MLMSNNDTRCQVARDVGAKGMGKWVCRLEVMLGGVLKVGGMHEWNGCEESFPALILLCLLRRR